MRISIFGLGYAGLVTALCHAADGHEVVGVDNDAGKLEKLRQGVSPISEPAIDDLLRGALSLGSLTLTADASAAVTSTDAALICVGTPSPEAGIPGSRCRRGGNSRDRGRSQRNANAVYCSSPEVPYHLEPPGVLSQASWSKSL